MHRLRGDSNAAFPRTAAQTYSPRPLTDGERWTAEALLELRRGGYRFPAWLRFVNRSLERSSRARQAAPGLTRQARGWGVIGAAGWLAVCHLGGRRLLGHRVDVVRHLVAVVPAAEVDGALSGVGVGHAV